jgi:colanic acid/amylovoran biosynthesis glycosyltransferase
MTQIVYLTRSFPHKSETFIVNQIVAAIAKGFRVKILTYNYLYDSNSSQLELFSKFDLHNKVDEINFNIPKNRIIKLFKVFKLAIFFFKYIIRDKDLPIKKRLLLLPFQIQYFDKYRHINTFHVHFGNSSYDIVRMKKLGVLNSKIIISYHGFDAHSIDDLDYKKKKNLYENTFNYSDYITVNSKYLMKKLLDLGCPENKILIIPMGIDTNFFKADIKINQKKDQLFRCISVGRLIPLKGHIYAIKAVNELISLGCKIEYSIIGDGELYDELNTLIKKLELSENIKLLGFKNQSEIHRLLGKTDIFLMSSTKDKTGRAETQGQVTAEAQAMGIPVVAFDSGGISETILNNKTGILVKDKDVLGFVKAIQLLIDDKNLRKKMSENAIEFARHKFNLNTNTELLFSYY